MDWLNEVTLEFLGLYEQEPVIWNPKHRFHKNRAERNKAWQRIQNEFGLECSIIDLKKKKESLMSHFRTVQNKVNARKTSVNNSDEVYKPTWFAYETMASFLEGIYQPMGPINREDFEDSTICCDTELNHEEIDVKTELNETISNSSDRIESGLESPCETEVDDEACIVYANLVVAKLRNFDENTRDILMHEIDCLIFKTMMQERNVTDQSLLINE